jgi:hypothetical protein
MSWRHIGGWRYSSTFLDLGTRWRWVDSYKSLPLYHRGNNLRYLLDMRLGGPQIGFRRCGDEKCLTPAGNQTRVAQSVARRYTDWAITTPVMACLRTTSWRSMVTGSKGPPIPNFCLYGGEQQPSQTLRAQLYRSRHWRKKRKRKRRRRSRGRMRMRGIIRGEMERARGVWGGWVRLRGREKWKYRKKEANRKKGLSKKREWWRKWRRITNNGEGTEKGQ